jgi:metal-sulfur cluster biosynthetic enzyme
MGLIETVQISPDGDIRINLRLTAPGCHMVAYMSEEAIARVGALPGVRSVEVVPDAGLDWSPSMIAPAARRRREARLARLHGSRMTLSPPPLTNSNHVRGS